MRTKAFLEKHLLRRDNDWVLWLWYFIWMGRFRAEHWAWALDWIPDGGVLEYTS